MSQHEYKIVLYVTVETGAALADVPEHIQTLARTKLQWQRHHAGGTEITSIGSVKAVRVDQ